MTTIDVALVCATVVCTYAMRLRDVRTSKQAMDAVASAIASAERMAQTDERIDALDKAAKALESRVNSLAMRK